MTQIPRRLAPVPVLPPVPGCLTAPRRLLVLPQPAEGDSSPWPRVVKAASTKRHIAAEDPAWDVVDEWGLQSFPASDPPPNRP